ncbi:hypothetical protein NT6N_25360 [Oceaniferula spumae]|uniref:Uncharacterized protein n=1 Tax=Oceaniferula spumae TaxID=2979115 RepID=A0AAT9FNA2_9BACT
MDSSATALFEFTRSRVTDEDIVNFSPSDPGYPNYVKLWTQIRRSGVIPNDADFDLTEVIGLTGWAKPKEWKKPERFRIYRRFTSAVGIALLHQGHDSETVRPANYLARDLLIDLDPSSERHITLMRDVCKSTRIILSTTNLDEGYPFFTLASMILAQKAGAWNEAEAAASQLIEDENAVRSNEILNWLVQDDRFLLGLSVYDQLHGDWKAIAKELKNPNQHEETQLVIDVLSQ